MADRYLPDGSRHQREADRREQSGRIATQQAMVAKNNQVARLRDGGIGWRRDGIGISQSLGGGVEEFKELFAAKASEVEVESLLLQVHQFRRELVIVP